MRYLLALLLACLLCGCAEAPASPDSPSPTPKTSRTEAIPENRDMVSRTCGTVTAYPIPIPDVQGVRAWGNHLLLFSGSETTTLSILSCEDLQVTASAELDCLLSCRDPSLRLEDDAFSFYDAVKGQTVVMDVSLSPVGHIAAPEDIVGTPILSSDRNTLYYCTPRAVMAWNLESGIRRTLKEMAFETQSVKGLHMEDAVIQCGIQEGGKEAAVFLSTENGQQLSHHDGSITLTDLGIHYYATFPAGITQAMVFGEGETPPLALTPDDLTASCLFLEESQAAVTISVPSGAHIRFDYYDLSSGLRRSSLTLSSQHQPIAVEDTADGSVYILMYDMSYGCEALYRWDIRQMPLDDKAIYTGPHYTKENPDRLGLSLCQTYAAEIGSKHGIQVLVWEDATAVQPWDYDLETEYLAPVLQEQLLLLKQWLDAYPEGFLAKTASPFTSLKLCLVRSITGTAESGSLDTATGIQFLEGTDAYVVIALGPHTRQAVYHELFHVMETYIWNESIALDRWDNLNPAGFNYDYSYLTNKDRDSGVFLQEENRAFIDIYSMSYPKEDRARIMEYAMLPGNKDLFRAETLQRKLKTLCEGIREAYGLKKSPETYPWEQYLKKSLAYTK